MGNTRDIVTVIGALFVLYIFFNEPSEYIHFEIGLFTKLILSLLIVLTTIPSLDNLTSQLEIKTAAKLASICIRLSFFLFFLLIINGFLKLDISPFVFKSTMFCSFVLLFLAFLIGNNPKIGLIPPFGKW